LAAGRKKRAIEFSWFRSALRSNKVTDQAQKRMAKTMEQTKENGGNQEPARQVDLSLLLDVPLQVTVELGRTRMTIESLLKLTQGSVVELTQTVGEPLDIYVNNRLMARGEAVIMKDKFAMRIVDVISPERRIENLR
jgi:flagellar motor switch protein FliN/FliY